VVLFFVFHRLFLLVRTLSIFLRVPETRRRLVWDWDLDRANEPEKSEICLFMIEVPPPPINDRIKTPPNRLTRTPNLRQKRPAPGASKPLKLGLEPEGRGRSARGEFREVVPRLFGKAAVLETVSGTTTATKTTKSGTSDRPHTTPGRRLTLGR